MEECRQVFSPVRLKPLPGKPFSFTVENRYDFSSLDHVALRWELRSVELPAESAAGEKILAKEQRDLSAVESGESIEVNFPVPQGFDTAQYGGALYIHAEFILKNDTPWAKAGLVIGRGERIIKDEGNALSQGIASVSGAGSAATGSGVAAASTSPAPEGFLGPFAPNLYRVPTENDGLKTVIHLRGDPAAKFYYFEKPMYYWIDLDLLHLRTASEKNEGISWDGYAANRFTASLLAGKDAAPEYKDKKLGTYTCVTVPAADKRPFIMDLTFDLDPALPELPRIGITIPFPALYDTVTWFGLGPHESYPDRLDGAFLGLYQSKAADMGTPYIVPQENGSRSGVRWLSLSGKQDAQSPLVIRSAEPVFFSVQKYSAENMTAALHTPELVDISADTSAGGNGRFLLNIDCAQRGVGTATCGPDTRQEYRVRPGFYRMRLFIG
jgi:beta-galactosidase